VPPTSEAKKENDVEEATEQKRCTGMYSRPCCRTGRHLIDKPSTLRGEKLQFWQ